MENLFINSTKVSPAINFQRDGNLKIEGKIITENAVVTFNPIINWLKDFNGDHIDFDIYLEYINTSATMQLFSVLNSLNENNKIRNIKINWFYDEDDEDHLETGELFQDKLDRTEFNYIMVKDTAA